MKRILAVCLGLLALPLLAEVDPVAREEVEIIRSGKNHTKQIRILRVRNDATIGGDLTVTGDLALGSDVTLGTSAKLFKTLKDVEVSTTPGTIVIQSSVIVLTGTGGELNTTNEFRLPAALNLVGQDLLLAVSLASTNYVTLTNNATTIKMSADWVGKPGDTLQVYALPNAAGDNAQWVELGRSNNNPE